MKTTKNIYGIALVPMRSLAPPIKAQYLYVANDYNNTIGENALTAHQLIPRTFQG